MDRILGAQARRALRFLREMFRMPEGLREATPETHPHADWRGYTRAAEKLGRGGFVVLGDVAHPGRGTSALHEPVDRLLVSEDRAVLVHLARRRLRLTPAGLALRLLVRPRLAVACRTELEDGRAVDTWTGTPAPITLELPWVDRAFIPDASIERLLAEHRRRISVAMAGDRTAFVPWDGLDHVMAWHRRTAERAIAHRRAIGWTTREELARITRTAGTDLDRVEELFRALVAAEGGSAPVPAAAP